MNRQLLGWLVWLVTLVAGVLVAGEEPFSQLNGPILTVEEWRYKVEMRFGKPEEILERHSKTFYDEYLNPIETIYFSLTGEIEERYVRTFDSSGRLVQIIKYDGASRLVAQTTTEYEGFVEFARTYNADGHLISATRREMDAQGRVLRLTTYDVESGEEKATITYSYTPEGYPLLTTMVVKGTSTTIEYTYDFEGMDVISQFTLYLLGIKISSKITGTRIISVDQYGNWTEKHTFERKEQFGRVEWVPQYVYRREITYRENSP